MLTCTFVGIVIGCSTNAINGRISPDYFVTILDWETVPNIVLAAIAQGIFEGLIYGLILGSVFAWSVGTFRCPFRVVRQYIAGIAVGTYCTWGIGGLIAVGLASLSPAFYRQTFTVAASLAGRSKT